MPESGKNAARQVLIPRGGRLREPLQIHGENAKRSRGEPLRRSAVAKKRMVEAAGIEPASEGASTWASTCVVCPLVIRPAETRQTRFSASLGDCYSHRVIATPRLEVRWFAPRIR